MKIENVLIFNTDQCKFMHGSLSHENGIITEILYDGESGEGCDRIIPGFVEVHTHGRCGYDIMACGETDLVKMSKEYAKTGVTSLFPTVMTAPFEEIEKSIYNIKSSADKCACHIDGVHVEGPYISAKRPGCHTIDLIRNPKSEELLSLIEKISPLKAHFTIAPEEIGGVSAVEACVRAGATVGIGHSDATYDVCQSALNIGACTFTHTFNAMRPLLHREPGCVGCALESDAFAEFIADGIHLSPHVINLSYKAKGNDKFVLVTDSIAAAGMPDGEYALSGIPVSVTNGKITTKDGTIAGSALSMPNAVKNLMEFAKIPFEEALICATANPAKQVGIYDKCGSLEKGKRADIVVIPHDGFAIKNVLVGGKFLY